jgi:haloalkane dehalogenase
MNNLLAPMGNKTILLDGVTISYREAGAADAPVALALHGYPSSSALWLPVLNSAESLKVRLIAPDLPGYGHSQLWRRPASWANHTAFVEAFRLALGLEKFHLLVHDWGGPTGLRWAIDNPGHLLSLFVTNTIFYSDYGWHSFSIQLRTPGEGEVALERRAGWEIFKRGMNRTFPWLSDETLHEWHRAYTTEELRAAQLELYRSASTEEFQRYESKLSTLKVKASIAWGASDAFIPRSFAERFATDLKTPRLLWLDEGGHFWHHQNPDFLVKCYEDHLQA